MQPKGDQAAYTWYFKEQLEKRKQEQESKENIVQVEDQTQKSKEPHTLPASPPHPTQIDSQPVNMVQEEDQTQESKEPQTLPASPPHPTQIDSPQPVNMVQEEDQTQESKEPHTLPASFSTTSNSNRFSSTSEYGTSGRSDTRI